MFFKLFPNNFENIFRKVGKIVLDQGWQDQFDLPESELNIC